MSPEEIIEEVEAERFNDFEGTTREERRWMQIAENLAHAYIAARTTIEGNHP